MTIESPAGSGRAIGEWQLLSGRDGPPPERRRLRAGPLAMVFESGDLRYVKLGGREVIRRIYAAVRDRNWGTVPGRISDLRFQVSDLAFHIEYLSTHQQGDIRFAWRAVISGDDSGAIRFAFDGEAGSAFDRNRIGLCVLHPIRECAGVRCRLHYCDGREGEASFPEGIAAEQPVPGFSDLAGLDCEIEPGIRAELRFEGDAFETEDQRNWIDASFKTYGTPLSLPFPQRIERGTRVRQEVRLKLAGRASAEISGAPVRSTLGNLSVSGEADCTATVIEVAEGTARLPAIGLGASSLSRQDDPPDLARFRPLRLSHLRHEVRLARASWKIDLCGAAAEAGRLALPLELAIHLPASPGHELRELADWCGAEHPELSGPGGIARVLALQEGRKSTTTTALEAVRETFGRFGVPIGAGTNADLYQLNLQRPPATADFIAWSMNPQVHAFDNASIAETPDAAAQQIGSVRRCFPGKLLVVSPVTLKPRFNPVATGPEPPVPPGELPSQVDPRQMSLFGAAWTVAMIKALSEGGVSSVTFFETTGWRGVMELDSGSPLPRKFPSLPGAVFPLYHVLADAGEFAAGEVLLTTSSEPLNVQGLMLRNGRRRRLLLANLQPYPVRTILPESTQSWSLRRLNSGTAIQAMSDPDAFRGCGAPASAPAREIALTLAPYEVATLDFHSTVH